MRPNRFFFSQPMRRKTKARLRSKNQVFRQEFSFSFGSPGVTANALTHFATLPDHVLVHMCYGRALIRPGAPFKAGRISVKMEWSLILARLDANKVNAAAAAKPRCHSKNSSVCFFLFVALGPRFGCCWNFYFPQSVPRVRRWIDQLKKTTTTSATTAATTSTSDNVSAWARMRVGLVLKIPLKPSSVRSTV